MDKALQQRLLGAVILAALLVIFVPEWLDGAGHKSRYPQHIEMRAKPVFQPMQEMPSASPQEAKKTPLIVTNRIRSSVHAWALQVGSFKDRANAQALKDRLIGEGFPAYVDALKTAKKTSYRVRIGPALDRSRVKKLQQKVLKEEKLKGMIVIHP